MNSPFIKLMTVGAGYGLVRTTYKTHKAQIKQYNYSTGKHKLRPLMVTEKIPVIILGSLVSSIYWPILIYHDVYSLEMNMRGYADEDTAGNLYRSPMDIIFL